MSGHGSFLDLFVPPLFSFPYSPKIKFKKKMYSLWCVVVGDTALFSSLCLCFFFPCVVLEHGSLLLLEKKLKLT